MIIMNSETAVTFTRGHFNQMVFAVWGTDITREMCLGAHISRGNTYHCNTVTVLLIVFLSQLSQGQSAESLHQKAVFKLGTRLVQVARNSLLDSDSLRTYLQHLKAMYLRERAEGRGGGASQEGVGGGLEE